MNAPDFVRIRTELPLGGTDLHEVGPEELARGIAGHEFEVAFQPKIGARDGVLYGFEALARWNSPRIGPVPPDSFIRVAERTGQIDALTTQIFDLALSAFARIQSREEFYRRSRFARQKVQLCNLSLNLSARSVPQSDIVERLVGMCERHGVLPSNVTLELTETAMLHDPQGSARVLHALRAAGFMLAMDDFGSGYASMAMLVQQPFNEIKIDRMFLSCGGQSRESRAVVRSIVTLARSLGMTSTAEGVEDDQALEFLADVGCDQVQGFAIGRPMSADEVTCWVDERYVGDAESRRVAALYALQLLDTDPEERFDRLTRCAQQIFHVPIVLISLVDARRQWFKSRQGWAVQETPREMGFCLHVVADSRALVVPDTHSDTRFRSHPLVTGDPGIRFYAGQPLHAPDGSIVGALCLIDRKPREFDGEAQNLLSDLARVVEREMCLPAATVV